MPVLCCNARRRKNKSDVDSPDSQYKKGLFGLMFAKIDEFETLTPLMTTPDTADEAGTSNKRIPTVSTDDSPPLPRRSSGGRTMVVPLAGIKDRGTAVGGAPDNADSRITSGDCTTKSCVTIPEDEENPPSPTGPVKLDADLISIDRTSASFLETRPVRYTPRTILSLPTAAPPFDIPTPLYIPPPPPDRFRPMLFVRSPKNFVRREFAASTEGIYNNSNVNDRLTNNSNIPKSSTCDSITSFSSPAESSYGTDSPLDTNNSISDNIYFPSDSDMDSGVKTTYSLQDDEKGNMGNYEYINGGSTNELQVPSKCLLDRIEEESEPNMDDRCCGSDSKVTETTSSLLFRNGFVDSEHNVIFPRSVSQQYIFPMENTK